MTSKLSVLLCLFGLGLVGCSDEAPSGSRGAPRFVEPPPADPHQVPEETLEALRALLSAPGDALPSHEIIESHVDGQRGLHWLAGNDHSVRVRRRALASLSMFPSTGSEFILANVLSADNPGWAKAAAIEGLQGWDLSIRDDLRKLVSAQLYNEDARTASTAARVLGPVPEARGELERCLAQSPDPLVADEIRAWL